MSSKARERRRKFLERQQKRERFARQLARSVTHEVGKPLGVFGIRECREQMFYVGYSSRGALFKWPPRKPLPRAVLVTRKKNRWLTVLDLLKNLFRRG